MKVLLINSEHKISGGAHVVYLNTAKLLVSQGHEVYFFAAHSDNEIKCEQSVFFAPKIDQRSKMNYIRNRFYNINAANNLQKLIDSVKPDIAHAHLMWGTLAPSILDVLKKNNIPVVHSVHDYAMICSLATLRSTYGGVCERCSRGHYLGSVITKCHRGSFLRSLIATTEIFERNKKHHPVDLISHFIFVSKFCSEKHCEMDNRFDFAEKSVLYNIPNDVVNEMAKKQMPETYNSYYLYYGRLSYEKGVETLIKAFVDFPELKLKIVGSGPLEERLKLLSKGHKANNIEFLGFKTGNDLFDIVAHSKFVCVPSEWYENNPMTIVEPYTLGVPVIAANIGGIPEIVDNKKTGLLFKSGSVESLREAIINSINMSREEYNQVKQFAKDFSCKHFEQGKYIEKLLEIYNSAISANK